MDWFESLAGFRETRYDETRAAPAVIPRGGKNNPDRRTYWRTIAVSLAAVLSMLSAGIVAEPPGSPVKSGAGAAPVRTFASCSNVRFQFIMGNATVIELSPYGPAHPLPSCMRTRKRSATTAAG